MSEDIVPKCIKCSMNFNWEGSYLCQSTPGLNPPPGQGSWGPILYCPYCGGLIATMDRSWIKDEWEWFGENATINEECPLPPDPWMFLFFKSIPKHLVPMYEESRLDIDKLKLFERESEVSEPELSVEAKEHYNRALRLFSNNELDEALEKLEVAYSFEPIEATYATALGVIGIKYAQLRKNVDLAFECCLKSTKIYPSASWQAHFLLSLVYEAQGENEKSKQAYIEARRNAVTVWWKPEVEREIRQIVREWAMKKSEVSKPKLSGAMKEHYFNALRLRTQDLDKALEELEVASSLGLSKKDYAFGLGQIGVEFALRKNVDSAIECCLKSVEIDPSASWPAHNFLSMVYEAKGESEKAKQELNMARKIKGDVWLIHHGENEMRQSIEMWTRKKTKKSKKRWKFW